MTICIYRHFSIAFCGDFSIRRTSRDCYQTQSTAHDTVGFDFNCQVRRTTLSCAIFFFNFHSCLPSIYTFLSRVSIYTCTSLTLPSPLLYLIQLSFSSVLYYAILFYSCCSFRVHHVGDESLHGLDFHTRQNSLRYYTSLRI